MNKIYRTLWNKVTQSWVVTSELAKSGGKGSSSKFALVNTAKSFNLTFIATSILLATGAVSAAEILGNKHTITTPPNNGNYCFFNKESESVVCGDENTKTVDKISNKSAKSVVLGKETSNDGESNVAIGSKSKTSATATIAIGSSAMAKADQAIALGLEAEGNSQFDISIGRFAGKQTSSNGAGRNIAIGDGALKNGLNVDNNTVLGTSAAGNLKGSHNIVMGAYANEATAIEQAIKNGSTIAQIRTKSRQIDSKETKYIEASNTIVIGQRALATQTAAIAIGQQAKAFGVTTVAVGNGSRALNNNAVAMGREANAGEAGAIAIGLRANYDSKYENQSNAYKKAGANSVAIGVYTHSEGTHSIAMGTNATVKELLSSDFTADKITDKKGNTINKKDLGTYLTGNGSVSIGSDSLVRGTNAVAIGQAAETLGQNAFAGGNDSHANGKSAVAIGDGATALKDSSTAIGSYTKALEGGAGAFGYHAYALAFRSLALGAEAIASKGSSAIAIGDKAKSESQDAIAVGREAHAKVKDSIAIGQGVVTELLATDPATDQDGVIAIGSKGGPNTFTKAAGKAAIAIGRNSTAIGRGTVTLGDNSHSTKGQAISIGAAVKSSGAGSVAIGSTAESSGDHAVSLAVASKSTGHRSLAFGYQALATHNDSVALGAGAETAEVVKTNEATVNTFKYSGFAGTAPIATVSVGKAGKERTITNVAAGRIDKTSTDAINGSQLYLALNTLGNVGNTLVNNVLGGNASIDKNGDTAGTLSFTDIGGTGQTTIHAAIQAVNNTAKAAKTGVEAGKNIVVTEKAGPDGNKIYTVETAKEVEFDKTTVGDVVIDKKTNDITGLANKELGSNTFAKNGRAATEEQLNKAIDNTVNILGGTAKNENGVLSMTNIGDTGANNIHDAIKAVNATAKASKTTVVEGDNIKVTTETAADGSRTYTVATQKDVKFDSAVAGGTKIDNNGLTFVDNSGNKIANSPNISKTGIDAGNQKVVNVANGDVSQNSKDAVNGSQLFAQGEGVKNIIGGNTTYNPATGAYTNNDIGGTGKNNINDAIKASRNEVKAGKNMVVTPTQGANGQTIYEVATADNVEFKEVKVGPKVTINEAGLQAGNIKVDATTNKISGIAKGEVSATSTDAVNGSQLHELNQKFDQQNNMLGNRINKVDRNLRAGIAGANAAAGLPQAYLPGKSMVAAAVGTYKGESAIAVGVSRISDNGKVIIKLTGNTNSRGDFGASIGAGYQW
ncbi:YadA-like family protein [Pasteurella multocida]|uniref:YadA-like family protein n=1 Tax=Pasteurella multocida TaxID=747 RepID=UPI00244D0469|nr:YadA-like family protein [Pasteurella multocida]MDH3003013.1 adhesin [Pasteurella multocida]